MKKLAVEIISGRRLNRRDDLAVFLTADLEELRAGADQIRQALCGDRADLCTIINGRSGRCSEDCKFCAQSCHYGTQVEEYPFLPLEKIVAECRRNEAGPTPGCIGRAGGSCAPPTASRPRRSSGA